MAASYRLIPRAGCHGVWTECTEWSSSQGNIQIGLLGKKFFLTADADNVRAILATQFKDFVTGPNRAGAFGYFVGKSIFTSDGPFWEHSRSLFKPHFATGHINDLEATERSCLDMFEAISARKNGQWTHPLDLQALFLRFTLDNGMEFLFGANVRSQLAAIPGASTIYQLDEVTRMAADTAGADMGFTEAFHVASLQVTKRAKLQSLYWLADSKEGRKAVKYLQKFCEYLVNATLQASEQTSANERTNPPQAKKQTLLKALAKDTHDPIELRDQVLFMLTAARDTTAALLSWMFLMLAKHPPVWEKLRESIIKDFGTEKAPKGVLTFSSLKHCTYLQNVMFETLRLYPPGPLNTRMAVRDTTLPVGGGDDGKSPIAVRKGETVNICVYAMQRRTDLWGEDALEFRPERWEGRKMDWSFLPFSGGPRTCMGQQYALTEAGYLTVRLLQRFDGIQAVEGLDVIEQFVTVTLEPTKGVNVRLREAASSYIASLSFEFVPSSNNFEQAEAGGSQHSTFNIVEVRKKGFTRRHECCGVQLPQGVAIPSG
ncbi:putative Cytochrome 52A11 [Glarea lozoyensis 74030]|uniref:Putative Cytochrome 52A11 n=1 Tax=Glarea lozoyensis (strain ATCC 74030 / MF5533) TaxID=1104152 RepID=H0EWA9_GLAL7|nr:putative Cytochrome 52A11 [Glarea lozoyensis 74030]